MMLVLAGVVIVASVALGRASYEVESAREAEYVELDDAWVHYKAGGEGPPVLLVHDWLSSSRIWERLSAQLQSSFTVYSLDLRGFGESDKPLSGYGIRRGGRLLHAFCAHFGITGAGVVGHGIGGDVAVKLAADHPETVGRLVLVCAPAREEQIDLPTPLWLATLPVIGPIFFALARSWRLWRRLGMRPFVLEKSSLEEQVVEDAAKPTPASFRATYGAVLREVSGGRLLRQARRIRAPALLVAGEDDQIVDPRSVESWVQSIPQTGAHYIERCGHLPMIEQPYEFGAHVLHFLAGGESSKTAGETLFPVDEGAKPSSEEDTAERDFVSPDEEPFGGAGERRREREDRDDEH